jgi:hypothetical protein
VNELKYSFASLKDAGPGWFGKWAQANADASEGEKLWFVFEGDYEYPLIHAITGNGPKSESNAELFCNAHKQAARIEALEGALGCLLDEVIMEKPCHSCWGIHPTNDHVDDCGLNNALEKAREVLNGN